MHQVFFNHTFILNHAFSLEILSFYMCVSKTMIIWGTVPETWSETEFFVLLSNYWPRKLKFGKNVKNTWGYFDFTFVYHKWQSYDVCFLRYGALKT